MPGERPPPGVSPGSPRSGFDLLHTRSRRLDAGARGAFLFVQYPPGPSKRRALLSYGCFCGIRLRPGPIEAFTEWLFIQNSESLPRAILSPSSTRGFSTRPAT